MTNESDSFIQEVDEGLRQDRAMSLLRKWGPYAAGLIVVILLAVGGWQVWRDQQVKAAQRESDGFAAALEQANGGDLDGAKTAFEQLSNQGPGSYRIMARMERAAILEQQGDLDAALTAYDEIAADANNDTMRNSARIRAAYIAAETQDLDALRTRLQPLIDGGGQVSYLAQELLGVEAWEAGQLDVARDTLENIRLAFDAPEAVRQRAELALAVIGPAPETASDAAPANQPTEGESQ